MTIYLILRVGEDFVASIHKQVNSPEQAQQETDFLNEQGQATGDSGYQWVEWKVQP